MTHSISASAHSFSLRAVSRRWTLGAALALTAAFGFAANAAHAEDLDDIKARGVLTIGTEGVYAPYTYHDEKGRLTGYDVEVGRAIAKKLGVEAKFVETPWDALIAGIDAKRYDIGINQIGLSPERLAKYDFTKPYVSIKGVLLVRSAEIVGVQDFAQSVQLIAQRRADAVVNSELAWVDYRKAQPNVPVKVVATTKEGIDVAIPVRKGNPKLLAALNQALDELRAEGVLKALSIKFLGIDVSTKYSLAASDLKEKFFCPHS